MGVATSCDKDASELLRRAMTGLAHARQRNKAYSYYSEDIEPNNIDLRLVNDDFCTFVQQQVPLLDASRLVFEVTETALFEDSGRAQQNIKALHALGIQFAVNDFGTGYS